MCFIYLVMAVQFYRKRVCQFSKVRQQKLGLLIVFYVFLMILYELYVEHAVGHIYGVPTDDDTGWIFRAATALASGDSVESLMNLVLSNSYDLANRALSFKNLGQYLYVFWLYPALYFPVVFDIRINLFIVYFVQILLVFGAAIDLSNALRMLVGTSSNKKYPYWGIWAAVCFCPIILFNSFKLLRETWYMFFMIEAFSSAVSCNTRKKKYKAMIYGAICLLIRPLSIIFLFPMLVYYCYDKHIGRVCVLGCSIAMLIGPPIMQKVASWIGWSYNIGSVSISEMLHMLLFPNIISQTKSILEIAKNPSWVTLLYFFQSVWNVVFIVVMLYGMVCAAMKKKQKEFPFWILMFINCIMFYTIPYSITSMTPRYKLIFLIPMMYFVAIGMYKIKRTIKIGLTR